MPQEIEVWYLIPALRRELAKVLIGEYGMSQKKVSEMFMITESAVSQYLKSKRGYELRFPKTGLEEIRKTAEKISSGEGEANNLLYMLCVKFRGTEHVCDFHRKQDKSLPKNCDLCC